MPPTSGGNSQAPLQLLERRPERGGRWFWWWNDRISPPAPAAGGCVACGVAMRPRARFCAHCGKGQFLVGASEEVELPAGRTVRVAEGLMLARYDPACPAWQLRAEAVGGVIDRASYPVLILVDVGESRARANLIVLRALSPSGIALSWGPGVELLPLEVDSDALRLLIRRHA